MRSSGELEAVSFVELRCSILGRKTGSDTFNQDALSSPGCFRRETA
ncbi:hypothetical protein BN903_145 [Halorubrum sp. AJ67]|nr:hypothetical protein BN903_145 [Halorubrum sp. AJ67]